MFVKTALVARYDLSLASVEAQLRPFGPPSDPRLRFLFGRKNHPPINGTGLDEAFCWTGAYFVRAPVNKVTPTHIVADDSCRKDEFNLEKGNLVRRPLLGPGPSLQS